MGDIEAIFTTRTSIRIQDGVLTKGGVKHCDGCGLDRSDIGGKEIAIDDLTLWICQSCDKPEVKAEVEL